MEQYQLETIPYSVAGSETDLLQRVWTIFHSRVARGERPQGLIVASQLSSNFIFLFFISVKNPTSMPYTEEAEAVDVCASPKMKSQKQASGEDLVFT